MGISFGGQQIRRPGAYSMVDTSGMTPISLGSFNVLAYVGVANNALAPLNLEEVRYYNSPKLASVDIVDGDLLENMRVAWGHGADLIAVSFVKPGASGAVPTDEEWQKAIDRLETEFVDAIIPVTTEPAIQSKVDAHISLMSNVTNRKERRGFYGHKAGLTATEVKALAPALASGRAMIASPAVLVTSGGVTAPKDSVLLASAYAGTWAGKEAQDPITYDYVKFAGLEKMYTALEIGDLLEAGIAVTEFVKNKGYRIVQGITTSASADLTEKELSVATLKDVMSRNLREILEEKHVGKAGVAGIQVTIYNDVISILEKFIKNGWITDYVRDSVEVIQDATSFIVDWEGKPTLPINNFLITSHFTL